MARYKPVKIRAGHSPFINTDNALLTYLLPYSMDHSLSWEATVSR